MWSRYGKAIVAVLLAAATAVHAAVSDSHITPQEAVQILIATATAAGVYLAPTLDAWPWAKTAVAGVLAALNVAVTVVVGGMSSGDWTEIVMAALTVVFVGAAPAVSIGGAVAEPPGTDGAL